MKKRLMACYASCLSLGQMKHKCPTAQPIAKSWVFDHRLVFSGGPRNATLRWSLHKGKKFPWSSGRYPLRTRPLWINITASNPATTTRYT